MKQTYLVKVLVSDVEHIFVEAENTEEAGLVALKKIADPDFSVFKDNINDFTVSNYKLRVISARKVNKNEIN